MNVKIEDMVYEFVSKDELIRILDKIDMLDGVNGFYDRKMVECHFGENDVNYCVQFHNKLPLSIAIIKYDSYSDNDATALELQSIFGGYALYFMSHLISDPKIMLGKDIWFAVDSTNRLYDKLIRFYDVFCKRYGLKKALYTNDGTEFTFYYSYPCSNEDKALEYFKNF